MAHIVPLDLLLLFLTNTRGTAALHNLEPVSLHTAAGEWHVGLISSVDLAAGVVHIANRRAAATIAFAEVTGFGRFASWAEYGEAVEWLHGVPLARVLADLSA